MDNNVDIFKHLDEGFNDIYFVNELVILYPRELYHEIMIKELELEPIFGLIGYVKKVYTDIHAFGHSSIYTHEILFENGYSRNLFAGSIQSYKPINDEKMEKLFKISPEIVKTIYKNIIEKIDAYGQ